MLTAFLSRKPSSLRQRALNQWTAVFNWGSPGEGMPDNGNESIGNEVL